MINFEYGKQFKGLVERIVADKKVGAMFDCIGYDDSDINRGELQKRFLDNLVSKSNLEKSFPKVATLEFEIIRNKFHLSDSYIVLSPSNSHVNRSGINYRAWPNSSWIKLISKLSCDFQVVIVGAKNESNFFKNLQPYPSSVVDLVGKNNVIELSSVIQNAKFVVCTDSAVGHISASVDTPVFVLMGPNNIFTDSPYRSPTNYVHPISLRKDCSPCYKTSIMKACKDNVCMNEITVDMVLTEISSAKFEKNKNKLTQIEINIFLDYLENIENQLKEFTNFAEDLKVFFHKNKMVLENKKLHKNYEKLKIATRLESVINGVYNRWESDYFNFLTQI